MAVVIVCVSSSLVSLDDGARGKVVLMFVFEPEVRHGVSNGFCRLGSDV